MMEPLERIGGEDYDLSRRREGTRTFLSLVVVCVVMTSNGLWPIRTPEIGLGPLKALRKY